MPKFLYQCENCEKKYLRYKRRENFNEPEFCVCSHAPLKRIFSASFQIIACREADKDENKLYKILTKGRGASDELALMREDNARLDKTMASMPDAPKEWTTEDTLGTGIIEAAQSGQEGIANWRRANIPPEKQYKDGETIGV